MILDWSRYPWMGRRAILNDKDYVPNTFGFPSSLIEFKKMSWTPDPKYHIHSFIQCITKCIWGTEKKAEEFLDVLEMFSGYKPNTKWLSEDMEKIIARAFRTNVYIFHEQFFKKMKLIRPFRSYEVYPGGGNIALLKSSKCYSYYILLLPDKKNKLKILNFRGYCYSCGIWRQLLGIEEHIKQCIKCPCGRAYLKGDNHPTQCTKGHYDKRRRENEDEIKRHHKEKNSFMIGNCHYADFETFTNNTLYHEVYAAGIISEGQDDPVIFYGHYALEGFMRYVIKNLDGYLWFFNGSRFDNFFILKWLLKNKIKIDNEKTLITGSNIVTLGFRTRKGGIYIKDLTKFLQGTLLANCKAFGIADDKSKKDFDHNLITSFENVYAHMNTVIPYLRNDVISLKEVYNNFAKAIFDLYNLYVCKYITIGQMSYVAWTTTLGNIRIFKTPLSDEDVFRELYRGGRVLCGTKKWKSRFWEKIKQEREGNVISNELYDEIDDFLEYADVNSLYPFAQVDIKYPIGRYKIKKIDYRNSELIKKRINEREKPYKLWVHRCGFQVDVNCPDDISIAFLMDRDDNGNVIQNLAEKKKKWYTGQELWEASKIGYKITKVYSIVEFKKSKIIFNDFVKPTYQRKKEAKAGPIYATTKTSLNSLTGKFGQKASFEKNVIILPHETVKKITTGIEPIIDKDGNLLGYHGKEQSDSKYSPYPIYLSAWILGWSRVIMSKYIRKMNLYRDPNHYVYYSDTDSLIVDSTCYERLPDEAKGASELGQMKKEVDGKIIAVYITAPKNYCYIYVDNKSKKILCSMKSKGISHPRDSYNPFECYPSSEEKENHALKEINFIERRKEIKNGSLYLSKTSILKEKTFSFYEIKDNGEKEYIYTSDFIPPKFLSLLLKKKVICYALNGVFKRRIDFFDVENITIGPDTMMREVNKTSWWDKGHRFFSEEDTGRYPPSYPLGHYKIKIC